MRGVKGRFVFEKNHRANNNHFWKEVTAAVPKLKQKYSRALPIVDYFEAVVHMAGAKESEEDENDMAQWAGGTADVNYQVSYMCELDLK